MCIRRICITGKRVFQAGRVAESIHPARNETGPGEEGRSSGELMVALFVLAASVLIGAAGGIWFAEREVLRREPHVTPAQTSAQPTKQEQSSAPVQPGPLSPQDREEKPRAEKLTPKTEPSIPPSKDPIRYLRQADSTNVTIELGGAALLRAARLHSPERLYFDLQNARRAGSPLGRMESGSAISANDDLLAGVRVAWKEPGTARIVLDLKRSCEFSYRVVPQPTPRLVVDLRETR